MTHAIQFSVTLDGDDLDAKLAFAKERRLGIEIDALFAGRPLTDRSFRKRMEARLKAALRGFTGKRSLHGAFIDIAVHSGDPAIAGIARQRILRDLETASFLGCQLVVFHTGFNPLVPGRQYVDQFLEHHASFWPEMADRFPDIQICLENMWERSSNILERLFRVIQHPRVGLCLDVAHAHAYGQVDLQAWLKRLRRWIRHLHWNDNLGDTDSHLALGQGNIDWRMVQEFAGKLPESVSVLLEMKSLRAVRESLDYLDRLG